VLSHQTKTLEDAIQVFTKKADAGQVPNRKTGGMRKVSRAEQKVVISHVTTAVRAASGAADPMSVPLAPYLEVLVDAVKQDAKEHGRSAHREASSVRLFLRVVEGRKLKTQRRVVRDAILPEWLPLYDALTTLRDANGNRRNPRSARYPGYLYGFQSFLQLRKVSSPRDLPSYETICEWAEEAGGQRGKLDNWFTAYRTARQECDPSLPDLAPTPAGRHRGLRGLSNIEALVQAAAARDEEAREILGDRRASDVGNQLDLIRMLAPLIGEAVQIYLDGTGKSTAWQDAVITSTSCLLAELVRLGKADELAEMDHVDLFTRRVKVKLGATRESTSKLVKRHKQSSGGAGEISLFRACVDAAARRSFASSPIQVPGVQGDPAEVPWYTEAVFNDASAIWAVTDFVFGSGGGEAGEGLAANEPELWARIQLEYDLVRKHMKTANGRRQSVGHQQRCLLDFTWATLVCVGLSELWREARKLREEYHQACGVQAAGSPARERARRAYHNRLTDYVLAAILLDDGLRIRNYTFGRVNVHFLPDPVRGPDGRWVRIKGMKTLFRGFDDEAGLKIKREPGGAERVRRRALLPGIVDMELLSDYLLDARPHSLAACGLIENVEAYDPGKDEFALFVSPCSTHSTGAYNPASLSKRFGKFVHGFMKDILDREVPEWSALTGRDADRDEKRRWRGLFNAHRSRMFIGTYVGGLRGQWTRATELTNDRTATLEAYYNEVKPFFEEARKNAGIEHPHHFDEVVDALWEGEVIDWASFDPENPVASLEGEG